LKLKQAASWAEIISALGLVVSLIYVGIQVSDNTVATRSITASHANAEFIDWYAHVTADPELINLWYQGVREPEQLSKQETLRFILLMHMIMLQFQNNYYLVQEGTLDKKVLDSITFTITLIKGTGGFDMYWKLRNKLFYPEFKLFMEDLMYNSQHQASPTYQE